MHMLYRYQEFVISALVYELGVYLTTNDLNKSFSSNTVVEIVAHV